MDNDLEKINTFLNDNEENITTPLENDTNRSVAQNTSFVKTYLIEGIVDEYKKRDVYQSQKNLNEYRLSAFLEASQKLDYFQTLDLPSNADENQLQELLKKIDDKIKEIKEFRQENEKRIEHLKAEIIEKQEELNELSASFSALKEKVALQAVNSENGDCYTKEEVKDLLKREEEARKTLEYFQFEAMKKRNSLNMTIQNKRNLVEGPFDYGEYEIMCTETESNAEVIKQLKEEIQSFSQKSASIVNALSHLNQKLYSMQIESSAAEAKEKPLEDELKEMRGKLFEEKVKFASVNKKNEELQHKLILLRHPRLVEDYKNLLTENDMHRKEIERLKTDYERLKSFT